MTLLALTLVAKRWLTPDTLELRFERPPDFAFLPGQKIRFLQEGFTRDYTLVNGPQAAGLAICVRLVVAGRFSPQLAAAETGAVFAAEGPFGYFTLQPAGRRRVVWIAGGTGIAPFVAYALAGEQAELLLHGVRHPAELYYRELFNGRVSRYLGCISRGFENSDRELFNGRVTCYLEKHFAPAAYDFYLCGRGEMITEVMRIIDRRFEDSRVFSETFY